MSRCRPAPGLEAKLRDFLAGTPASPQTADTDWPRISIVMPSLNQGEFIDRSIRSIINQGYPNLELIVIDGGSVDGTLEILRRHAQYITYWESVPDRGQSHALNKGFSHATGEILGWLNADDLYAPGALRSAAAALEQHPEKGVVHGDWLHIDARDQVLEINYGMDFRLAQHWYEGFHCNAQAMFWRMAVHRRFPGFDEALHLTMDADMIAAFAFAEGDAGFLLLPAVLGCFRRHPAQKTRAMCRRVLAEYQRMAETYGRYDRYRVAGRIKRLRYRFRRGYWYLKRGGLCYTLRRLVLGGRGQVADS